MGLASLTHTSKSKVKIMEISKETKAAVKPALWGAAAGAIALAIVGFNWGGWVTGGTAEFDREEPCCNGRSSQFSHPSALTSSDKRLVPQRTWPK